MMELLIPIAVALITGTAMLVGKRILPSVEQTKVRQTTNAQVESVSVATMTAAMASLRGEFDRVKEDVDELREEVRSVKRVFRIAIKTLERFIVWARQGADEETPIVPAELFEYMDIPTLDEEREEARRNSR